MRALKRPWGFAGWRWAVLGQAQGRTLEIGCGWGHNFNHYPASATVTAFDVNADNLRTAAKRQAPIALLLADAQQLAWPDQTFDTVAGTLVFCSIPQPAQALAEARRVLKPGGRLLLVEHVRSHHHWLGGLQDALAPAWLWASQGCHLNRNTEATVRAAGFTLTKVQTGWAGALKLMVGVKN